MSTLWDRAVNLLFYIIRMSFYVFDYARSSVFISKISNGFIIFYKRLKISVSLVR